MVDSWDLAERERGTGCWLWNPLLVGDFGACGMSGWFCNIPRWGVFIFAKVRFASFAVLGPFSNGPYGWRFWCSWTGLWDGGLFAGCGGGWESPSGPAPPRSLTPALSRRAGEVVCWMVDGGFGWGSPSGPASRASPRCCLAFWASLVRAGLRLRRRGRWGCWPVPTVRVWGSGFGGMREFGFSVV